MKPKEVPIYLETQPSSVIAFDFRPFEPILAQILFINTTPSPVLFKVPTTAPTQYIVKPNFGVICPSEIITVDFIMQPVYHHPQPTSFKHKFQISAIPCPENTNIDAILQNQAEFLKFFDLLPSNSKQNTNLTAQLNFPAEGDRLEGISPSVSRRKKKAFFSSEVNRNPSIENSLESEELDNLEPTTNISENASPKMLSPVLQAMRNSSTITVENEVCVKERIELLEEKVNELWKDIKLTEKRNQGVIEKNIGIERKINELIAEKSRTREEVLQFKVKNVAIPEEKPSKSGTFGIQHMILMALLGLVLGGEIFPDLLK